jgi:hypothetical protein
MLQATSARPRVEGRMARQGSQSRLDRLA